MKKHEHFDEAVKLITKDGYCSNKQMMNYFQIGYNSAGFLMDQLEDAKIIGGFDGSHNRKALISPAFLVEGKQPENFKIGETAKLAENPLDEQLDEFIPLGRYIITDVLDTSKNEIGTSGQWVKIAEYNDWIDSSYFRKIDPVEGKKETPEEETELRFSAKDMENFAAKMLLSCKIEKPLHEELKIFVEKDMEATPKEPSKDQEELWISVEERLPEESDTRVLGFSPKYGRNVVSFFNGEFVNAQSTTHWMPLPEPPKTK